MTNLTRNDLRRAVLQRLDTFTERIEWVGGAADYAFADSIIEFAKWYADCQPQCDLCLPDDPCKSHSGR